MQNLNAENPRVQIKKGIVNEGMDILCGGQKIQHEEIIHSPKLMHRLSIILIKFQQNDYDTFKSPP